MPCLIDGFENVDSAERQSRDGRHHPPHPDHSGIRAVASRRQSVVQQQTRNQQCAKPMKKSAPLIFVVLRIVIHGCWYKGRQQQKGNNPGRKRYKIAS